MIIVEGSIQRLVEDGQKFFRYIRIIHSTLAGLMLANGVVAIIFTLGVDGDAQIPYFFSAFVMSVWHVVFVVLCQVCLHFLVPERSTLKHAPTWVNVYTVLSSVFVIFNVMGIVFVIVNGLCIRGQLCYYDKNEIINRFLAISLSLLHFISIGSSVFLAKKSHVIDSQLSEDITIRVKHSFIWGRRKSKVSKMSSSIGDGISEFSSTSTENDNNAIGGGDNSQEGAVVVTTTATSWLDKKRAVIAPRSKSHPNLRKHLELNQHIEGTVVSIYSDTEEKTDEGTPRRGKKRTVLSKRNRVTPTKSIRDSQGIVSKDSVGAEGLTSQCEIEINRYPLTVRIIDQQKPKLDSSTLRIKETGLLSQSQSQENSSLPSVDGRSYTDDSIVVNQESISKQQELAQNKEEMLTDQKDSQHPVSKQQEGTSMDAQTSVPGSTLVPMDDVFLSPPPPYSEVPDDVAL